MADTKLRDQFAAAALTGILANEGEGASLSGTCRWAYRIADAMLRERANHPAIPDSCPAVPRKPDADRLAEWERLGSHRWGLGVASDLYDLECRVADLEKDHIPDAGKMVATPGEWRAPNGCHPTAVWHELLRTKESIKDIADDVCGAGTGNNHSASACDGVDVLPDVGSGGPINHSAPACQPPVASRGSEESERRDVARPDTKGKVAGGPAHHTHEPVAWAVVYPSDEVAIIAFKRRDADERASASDSVVPLYRSPTLTDAEREAVKECLAFAFPAMHPTAATLRGLLDRTKTGRR